MSEKIFFTADTHFGHRRLIANTRPFDSVEQHDSELVARWNNRVSKGDRVYHLGDVGICHQTLLRPILDRLNGRIFLIRGNHEANAEHKICADRFEWIKDTHMLKLPGDHRVWLSHYAHRVWPSSHHGSWHLHGHSHGSLSDIGGMSFDVGVDCWNFEPVSFEDVAAKMAERTPLYPDGHNNQTTD